MMEGYSEVIAGITYQPDYSSIASEFLSVFRKITIRPSEEVLNLYRLVSSLVS
jgi:hypothetical protein